jgi:hypothetical protein
LQAYGVTDFEARTNLARATSRGVEVAAGEMLCFIWRFGRRCFDWRVRLRRW